MSARLVLPLLAATLALPSCAPGLRDEGYGGPGGYGYYGGPPAYGYGNGYGGGYGYGGYGPGLYRDRGYRRYDEDRGREERPRPLPPPAVQVGPPRGPDAPLNPGQRDTAINALRNFGR